MVSVRTAVLYGDGTGWSGVWSLWAGSCRSSSFRALFQQAGHARWGRTEQLAFNTPRARRADHARLTAAAEAARSALTEFWEAPLTVSELEAAEAGAEGALEAAMGSNEERKDAIKHVAEKQQVPDATVVHWAAIRAVHVGIARVRVGTACYGRHGRGVCDDRRRPGDDGAAGGGELSGWRGGSDAAGGGGRGGRADAVSTVERKQLEEGALGPGMKRSSRLSL